jgi:hypothetical protein
MAEFVIVTPILMMLLVIIGDFGRIFATSLSLEAAARDAAEIAANQYLADPPGGQLNVPSTGTSAYYTSMHQAIARTVCAETSDQPNSNYNSGSGLCAGMPLIQACVHDSTDTECASEAQGAAIPVECGGMAAPPTNTHAGSGTARWVEVRICYRFTPILALPLLSFGDFWLERTRTFVIPCYFKLGTDECG